MTENPERTYVASLERRIAELESRIKQMENDRQEAMRAVRRLIGRR